MKFDSANGLSTGKVIDRVNVTENVAIVSFGKVPAKIGLLSSLFDRVARAGINVDMISQTAPKGEYNSISFTVSDDKVGDVLNLLTRMDEKERDLMPMISTGNVKISLWGKEMPNLVGVASDVFDRLAEIGVEVLLITTSDVDISIVVDPASADLAYETLKKAYEGE